MTDTSESMVERVARAIYEGRNGRGARAWGSQPNAHKEPYRSDARAAIEAMREPTDEMIIEGVETLNHSLGDGSVMDRDPLFAWRAMIHVALQS